MTIFTIQKLHCYYVSQNGWLQNYSLVLTWLIFDGLTFVHPIDQNLEKPQQNYCVFQCKDKRRRQKQHLPAGEGSRIEDNRRDYRLIGSVRENR